MVEVTKSDWKLFVEKLPLWQERYMDWIEFTVKWKRMNCLFS